MTHLLFSCKEHIEIMLDQFVDQYEEAPDLYPLGYGSWQAELDEPAKVAVTPLLKHHPSCAWCEQKADYLLLKIPLENNEERTEE